MSNPVFANTDFRVRFVREIKEITIVKINFKMSLSSCLVMIITSSLKDSRK